VEAARVASSAAGALQIALDTLAEKSGASFAVIYERQGDRFRPVASHGTNDTLPILPPNGFLVNRFRFYSAGIPISPEDLESWRRWSLEYRPDYLAEVKTLQQLEVRFAAPLKSKSEMVGLLLLGLSTPIALRNWPHVLALMLENTRLTTRVLEQEKINRDLALAAEVQKRLLPEGYPDSNTAEFAAFTLPARSVGGDYYDFLRVSDRRVGIALADVAGKGIPAALIMTVVQASSRILATE
jgi:sigma-B regulation protein RsbU (phosphoserine phosphatase)